MKTGDRLRATIAAFSLLLAHVVPGACATLCARSACAHTHFEAPAGQSSCCPAPHEAPPADQAPAPREFQAAPSTEACSPCLAQVEISESKGPLADTTHPLSLKIPALPPATTTLHLTSAKPQSLPAHSAPARAPPAALPGFLPPFRAPPAL